jgi:hypothetical protein
MSATKTPPCPICGAWTDSKETRITSPYTRIRKYICANDHCFETQTTEVVTRIRVERGVYVPFVKETNDQTN